MPDKKPTKGTAHINYEMEYQRLKELCCELEHEIRQITSERDYYTLEIAEKEKVIIGLEGQIKAFKFCIAKGNVKNER
jgi:hypothetical protein